MRWLEILAFALLTFQLTRSPFLVIVVGLFRMVPLLLGSVLVGVATDRFDRKRIIAASLLAAAAGSATLAVLTATDRIEVWHLAFGAFISGCALLVDITVRRPLLGGLVTTESVGRAMATDLIANSSTRTVAPALGGLVIDAWGFGAVFLLGAGLYIAGLVVMATVSIPDPIGQRSDRPTLHQLIDTCRHAWSIPSVLTVIWFTLLMNLFVFPYQHLVPVVGEEVLGLGPALIGSLNAIEGIGMTTGVVAQAIWIRPSGYLRALLGGIALAALGVGGFGLSTWLPLSAVLVFIVGLGISGFTAMQTTIVVTESPAEVRSRMMGLVATMIGTNPLGLLVLGGAAALLGAAGGTALVGLIAVVLVGGAGIASPRLRQQLRRPADGTRT